MRKIIQKFVWLKVASVNILHSTFHDRAHFWRSHLYICYCIDKKFSSTKI